MLCGRVSGSAALRALRAGWAAVRGGKQEEQQQCRRVRHHTHSASIHAHAALTRTVLTWLHAAPGTCLTPGN